LKKLSQCVAEGTSVVATGVEKGAVRKRVLFMAEIFAVAA
jgi:hypothetical protein